ncbi:hypothetical protein [Lapillicoccus sp.]|uniref:hypothetical protein n=1 Tax=Lapillicoccus sp. TaxID=1909287 RepID=UPI0025D9A7F6|nr:hypothetical protein [Lapillicoccus sp.]
MDTKLNSRHAWWTGAAGLSAAVLAIAPAIPATAASTASPHPTPQRPLSVHTILKGAAHGWSSPDDLTDIGNDLFVSFQNGVPSTGGTPGMPTTSTIVKLSMNGTIEHTWQLTGKCDGLTADPVHHRLVATVNEDGNSSVYTISTNGEEVSHFTYDASPLPHGGGTDAVTIDQGRIYLVASAPAAAGPALYQVTLDGRTAHLVAAPFYDTSPATVVNTTLPHTRIHLALTDPDSSTMVPGQAPRFAGAFMLDAQGDQQAIFAAHLGAAKQALSVLKLSQSIDDTAFATTREGALVATDSTANTVDVITTDTFVPGRAYSAVTPGNANTPGPNPPPNYLGQLNLGTGVLTPLATTGARLTPHGLIYVPDRP